MISNLVRVCYIKKHDVLRLFDKMPDRSWFINIRLDNDIKSQYNVDTYETMRVFLWLFLFFYTPDFLMIIMEFIQIRLINPHKIHDD